MFRRKTTITRPGRARLLRVAGAKSNMISWAIFVDELRRELARSRVVDPARVPSDVVTMNSADGITQPATVRVPGSSGMREIGVDEVVYPPEARGRIRPRWPPRGTTRGRWSRPVRH